MNISGKLVAIAGLSALSYVAGCRHGRQLEENYNNITTSQDYKLRLMRDNNPDLFIKTSQELDSVPKEKTASFIDSVYSKIFYPSYKENAQIAKDTITKAAKETVKNIK